MIRTYKMEELHNIIADETLNVLASDDELRDHAKFLIDNEMSHVGQEDLINHLKRAGATKMAIKAIESVKNKEKSSGE